MAHTNARGSKFDLGGKKVKCQHDHHFSNFGRSPVPHNLCKDKGPGLIWLWRRRFLKFFTIYGHGSHFDQWTMPILAIFHSPAQGGFAWNLSNTGPGASEEKSFEIINIFSIQMYGAHTNAYRSKLDLAVKRLNVNV